MIMRPSSKIIHTVELKEDKGTMGIRGDAKDPYTTEPTRQFPKEVDHDRFFEDLFIELHLGAPNRSRRRTRSLERRNALSTLNHPFFKTEGNLTEGNVSKRNNLRKSLSTPCMGNENILLSSDDEEDEKEPVGDVKKNERPRYRRQNYSTGMIMNALNLRHGDRLDHLETHNNPTSSNPFIRRAGRKLELKKIVSYISLGTILNLGDKCQKVSDEDLPEKLQEHFNKTNCRNLYSIFRKSDKFDR
uniref:Uncharacterized protein n=1 Tax=Chaetoceros debilis TaxID=122233 RepID=A0A7S3VG73_9STRA